MRAPEPSKGTSGWRGLSWGWPGSETPFPGDFCHLKLKEGWGFVVTRLFLLLQIPLHIL